MKKIRIFLEKIISKFNLLLAVCGAVCLLEFIACIIYQVVARNVLPTAPIWTDEAARFLFIYMVAFGVGLAVHSGEYVGIELLIDLLPGRARDVIQTITKFILAAFCFWYFFASVKGFAFLDYRYLSTAMQLPMQYVYISMVILFPVLGLSYIASALLHMLPKTDISTEQGEKEV